MAIKINNWTKIKLLLWKNWLILLNHKIITIFEILIPAFFTYLLVVIRKSVDPIKYQKRSFMPRDIYSLYLIKKAVMEMPPQNAPLFELIYSPRNPILQQIMSKASGGLDLPLKSVLNAERLESELYHKNYLAGIEFDDSLSGIKELPEKLKFALRFPGDLRASSSKFGFSWQTSRLFPFVSGNYPRHFNFSDGGSPVGYLREGFLTLQHSISTSYIELIQNSLNKPAPLPYITLQRYPYGDFVYDPLLEGLQNIVSLIIILSFIYPCTYITKYVAYEKEKQLKEVMKIMGLQNWIHWTAWFVKAFISLILSSILMILLITIQWSNEVAVLTNSSVTAIFCFMVVYVIVSVCFCFMLAVFFSKASTAAAVTGLVWFISYIPFMLMIDTYGSLSYSEKISWCLISNTAMAFGIKIILGWEGNGDGLQWDNIWEPYTADDQLTVGTVMCMMLLSTFIYMLICLYVEQVFPGDFGLPKKWYFPVTPSFWCPEQKSSYDDDIIVARKSRTDKQHFEPDPKGLYAGVQVINLKKRFGNKWAVKGLSLNMYEDEITVLLGHNGAGKTTTISMLTGMFPATSGTALIDNYDISIDLDSARTSLGICPQHNVLFDDLSVANHITFFCRLKGLKSYKIKREIEKYLKLIDLEKKAHVPSSKLSGGMQRKLSVCCALCGGTKVVLLDEPSSGMDPAARRHLWNLIQGEKSGRTILITTHFMDEADVLGDRIAIMSDGELQCHGTSFFLKKKFGDGYSLICIKRDYCEPIEVTKLIRKHIKDIEPSSDLGAELAYQLPYEYSPKFEGLLKDLEENSEKLGISGYGIAITSMEEVFLKVGAEQFMRENPLEKFDLYRDEDAESIQSNMTFGATTVISARKPSLLFNQWRAMFLKKILYTWRKKLMFCIQNFIPIFFVIMTVIISRQGFVDSLPPISINLRQYPKAVTILEKPKEVKIASDEEKIVKAYTNIARSFGPKYEFQLINTDFTDYILNLGRTRQTRINLRYLIAASVYNGRVNAWYNNQPLHTAPLTINMVHNALAKAFLGDRYQIEVINKPLRPSADTQLKNLQSGNSLGGQLSSNVCFCMSFVSSLYILFVIHEKETKAKLLQFVSGVRFWIFWITQLIWDMLTFTFTCVVLVITLGCFQEQYASKFMELAEYFVVLIVFGYAALPLTYILSSYYTEPATGFARVSTFNIFLGMALHIVIMVMSNPLFNTKDTADDLMWIFMWHPHFSLAAGINELYIHTATADLCNADHVRALNDQILCEKLPDCCTNGKPGVPTAFDWERPGVGREIVHMLIVGSACFIILIAREYNLLQNKVIDCKRAMKKRPAPPRDDQIDSDVAFEKARIDGMTKEQIAHHNLLLKRVTKYYGHFLAVNQISLAVRPAECFGLLGVNGAGKTTTFKMLTGDEKLSYGKAYVRGYSVLTNMKSVYAEIGYCPQFDALLFDLTGREVLHIFCLLRAVPSYRIKYISEQLARGFGFLKHMDKAVKNYSGGNKRKLSTAIAVLGNPSVVYLDEPTTGMDPGARRRLWNVVCMVRDSGKSIVLTSHSMEECEALCTRLAIMVNGEFKCIGSIQHLKNKFSKGFILKIKIKTIPPLIPPPPPLTELDEEPSEQVVNDVMNDIARGSVDYFTPEAFTTDSEDEDGKRARIPQVKSANRLKPPIQIVPPFRPSELTLPPEWTAKLQSQMREANVNKVENAVKEKFTAAILQEYYQGMLTFYVPLAGVSWSQIFGFMEKNLEKLNIEDYSITQTTLEEIFLDFAKHQVDLRIHSKKKGCTACLKVK